jgi:drug/metabolite transporter (DMT)-like permease
VRLPVISAALAEGPLPPAAAAESPGHGPAVGYALVFAAVALWSVNSTVVKVVVDSAGLSPMRLAEARATAAALLLCLAIGIARPTSLRISLREAAYLAVFGIAGLALVHFFYFVAISRLDIGIALVIQYLSPVLIALWARFFEHEPVRRRLWFALALSHGGLSLVVELWSGGGLDGIGVAASLAAAVSFACYIVMADHGLQRGRDAFSLVAWGFVFAALFWALVQPWWTFPTEILTKESSLLGRFAEFNAPAWILLAYIVVLGTIVPFLMMVSALHYISPTRATIAAMSEPVGAGLVAFVWLREEIGPQQIAGGLLVLAGILLAQTARAVRN